jgi:hypothetical protein
MIVIASSNVLALITKQTWGILKKSLLEMILASGETLAKIHWTDEITSVGDGHL